MSNFQNAWQYKFTKPKYRILAWSQVNKISFCVVLVIRLPRLRQLPNNKKDGFIIDGLSQICESLNLVLIVECSSGLYQQ